MTPRLTKKLKATLRDRVILGMIRSLMPLHPEYDRPSIVDVRIDIKPNKDRKFLRIQQAYEIP
jgi:hypothetical protein